MKKSLILTYDSTIIRFYTNSYLDWIPCVEVLYSKESM